MSASDPTMPTAVVADPGPTRRGAREMLHRLPAGTYVQTVMLQPSGTYHFAALCRDMTELGELEKVARGLYRTPAEQPATQDEIDAVTEGRCRYIDAAGRQVPAPLPRNATPTMRRLDEPTLRQWYIDEGLTTGEIADRVTAEGLECSPDTVRRALERCNIEIRRRGPRPGIVTDGLTREVLEQRYLEDGETMAQIAESLGCSVRTVERACRRFDFPQRRGKVAEVLTEEVLRDKYVNEGWTDQQIGDEYGCSAASVGYARARYGIEARKTAQWDDVLTAEFLRERFDAGETVASIARELGCDRHTVTRWRDRHGLGSNA